MAEVYDRWHLSRPPKDAEPCTEHSTKSRALVPSADHGVGKRWQVRYRDTSGQQRKENFHKRSQADTRAATVEADLARGLYVDPNAGKETFRSVAERWRTSAVHRRATTDGVERLLRLHIYPTFGDRPIASVRRSDVQAWIKAKSQELAPTTLQVTYARLVTVFRTAVHDGILRASPCDGVKLPSARRPEIVPLHADAVRALIDAAPSHYRALLLLAAASGLRQGELLGLEVHHVDFLRRTVKVEQQLVGPDRGVPYIGEPKTHESYRTVPLARFAVDALAAHLAAFPPSGCLVEDRTDARKPRERKAVLLFPSERGEPVRRSRWSRAWGDIVQRANEALSKAYAEAYAAWVQRGRPKGQEPAPVRVPEGTSMHDLRHFYASALIEHRESVKTVQKRLGHSKASITLDVYAHLMPDGEDTTAAAVEAALGDVPSKCPASKAE